MKRYVNRWTLNLLVLACAAFVVACGGDNERGSPQPPTSAEVLATGPFGVGVTTMAFEDTSRPTMANGNFPGSDSRKLVTEIWYPTTAQADASMLDSRGVPVDRSEAPYPLVIYSHGFSDNRLGGAFLARHLASHGYVVASPDYPLSRMGAPGGPNLFDVVNQPQDVSFLIDRLLELNDTAGVLLSATLDANRIGLTGLSLGGLTTFLTTFHASLRDPRVRAAAPIAGPACFFGPDFFASARIPLMIVHGEIDAIVPYRENGLFGFEQAGPDKILVTLRQASHTGFTDFATSPIFAALDNPDDLGCQAIQGALPDDPPREDAFTNLLGGADAGLIAGDCPAACTGPFPLPAAMPPARQHDLTVLSIYPFFEETLRNRREMKMFLEDVLAVENADVSVQFGS